MITIQEFRQTLEYHSTLNTKIFKNNKLKSNVVGQLLKIADLFRKDCNISEDLVKDIILTGGNANYNYTLISDIDVHIIVDFSQIQSGTTNLEDYYKTKKNLWTVNHDIKIYGYPVELYIEKFGAAHPSNQGIYSILNKKWVVYPERIQVNYEDPKLIDKVDKFWDLINHCDTIGDARFLKDKLKGMRTSGLETGGEYSVENLTFKALRNMGYIDKLDKKYKLMQDMRLSL